MLVPQYRTKRHHNNTVFTPLTYPWKFSCLEKLDIKKSPQFDNWKIVFWFKVHLIPGVWGRKSDAKTQNSDGLNIRCVKHKSALDGEG